MWWFMLLPGGLAAPRPRGPPMSEQGTIYEAMMAAAAPRAAARRTDPDTSWEAAVSLGDLRELQRQVLEFLVELGPATHEELVAAWQRRTGVHRPSTIRTRVRELQRLGFVRVRSREGRTAGGRRCCVWEGSREPRWPAEPQPPRKSPLTAADSASDALRAGEPPRAALVGDLRALLASGGSPGAILAAIQGRLDREG